MKTKETKIKKEVNKIKINKITKEQELTNLKKELGILLEEKDLLNEKYNSVINSNNKVSIDNMLKGIIIEEANKYIKLLEQKNKSLKTILFLSFIFFILVLIF